MNSFEQHFFNACSRLITESLDKDTIEILDNFGLNGNFIMNECPELDRIPPHERIAFGILLGILYERDRVSAIN